MDIKPILRTALIAQSAALAGESLKLMKKKKKKAKNFLGVAAGTLAGTSLLAAEGDFRYFIFSFPNC